MADTLPPIGTRLSLAGHLGTVRFTGAVHGASGLWLGVEWDDPQRGKHSGTKDGKQYFSCRIPNAGSFIRPSVHVSYGVSFLEALHAKYIDLPHGSQSIEKIVLGSSHGVIHVEAANLDKIRQKLSNLATLRFVSLDGLLVSRTNEPASVRNTCPDVRGLNLSMSLLPSWEAIATITSELSQLQSLALNANRFEPIREPDRLVSAFLSVSELQLNKTLSSWTDMENIIAFMPHIQVVELGYNHIDRLTPTADNATISDSNSGIRALETLNLDSNHLEDWVHIIQSLQPYISLTRVILSSNNIQAIPPPNGHAPSSVIRSVSLSSNKLASWNAIDALYRWFPNIEALYACDTPLLQGNEFARQLIIAKIPTLKTLDATVISARERTDSELFYLSRVAKSESGSSEESRRADHPQWEALRRKHGMLDDPEVRPQPAFDRMKNRLIDLTTYPRLSASERVSDALARPPTTLRVLPSMQLRTLRLKLRKVAKSKADASAVGVWAVMQGGALAELPASRDKEDIAWLGLDQDSAVVFHIDE